MPELPEVETVRRNLKKEVLNKKIKSVEVRCIKMIAYPELEKFKKDLVNQTINDLKRRGKWLLFELDNYYLLSHLRMEGRYVIRNINDEFAKHDDVIFNFTDNTSLRYQDTRKFGKMYLYPKEGIYDKKPLNELGLEPWDKELTIKYLKDKIGKKSLAIKPLLLDQSIIVGLGNIYVDEVLFASKINPTTKAKDLKTKDYENIIKYTKEILDKAIKYGGTTIKTFESKEGVHGLFQDMLQVHTRKICPNCGKDIIKIRVGGRGTYYCPKCQKEKK